MKGTVQSKARLYYPLLLMLLGAAVYWNALGGPLVFDDHIAISRNPGIRDITDLHTIYNLDMRYNYTKTRFFLFLTFAFNYHLHGLSPAGYHIFNLAVHLLNGLLLFWLIRLFFQTPALSASPVKERKDFLAFTAAAIFLVHPITTEAVNYVYQRAECLFSLFLLIILICYLKGRLHLDRGSAFFSAAHIAYLAAALAAGLLGAFTKENIMIYPAVLLLLEIFLFPGILKGAVRKAGYILLFALPLIPLFCLMSLADRLTTEVTRHQFFLTQIRVVVTYLRLLILPFGQNLIHTFPLSRTLWEGAVLLSLAGHLALAAVAAACFRRYRLVSLGIAWFYLLIAPSSSIQPIDTIICEYRVYLPLAGFALLAAAVLCHVNIRQAARRILVACLLAALCVTTVMRNRVWRTELRLWEDTVAKSPRVIKALNNLGVIYSEAGRPLKAEALYLRALEIEPDHVKSLINLGTLYAQQQQYDEALAVYQRLLSKDLANNQVFYNLGTIYLGKGDYPAALGFYLRAEQEDYYDPGIHYNLAVCYKNLGDYDAALDRLNRLLEIDDLYNGINIHQEIGAVHFLRNDFKHALQAYMRARDLEPGKADIYMMIGMLFHRHKRPIRAVNAFETAIQIDPGNEEAHYNLGLLYMRKYKDKKKALRHFRSYIRLASGDDDTADVRRLIAELETWPDDPAP
jgi:tetratricopeptide (TPR) repeat protein